MTYLAVRHMTKSMCILKFCFPVNHWNQCFVLPFDSVVVRGGGGDTGRLDQNNNAERKFRKTETGVIARKRLRLPLNNGTHFCYQEHILRNKTAGSENI